VTASAEPEITLYFGGLCSRVNNIHHAVRPARPFENVTCTFMAGRRYAVNRVRNGAGKSTFMKILTGEIFSHSTSGSITRRKKSVLAARSVCAYDEYRVIDTRHMGNASLGNGARKNATLSTPSPMNELTDADGMPLGAEGIVGEKAATRRKRMRRGLLDGLGVEASLHERKMSELQGGPQKVARATGARHFLGIRRRLLLERTGREQPGP